jgi:hypothetical protein
MDNGKEQMKIGFMVEGMREEWCNILQEYLPKPPHSKEGVLKVKEELVL